MGPSTIVTEGDLSRNSSRESGDELLVFGRGIVGVSLEFLCFVFIKREGERCIVMEGRGRREGGGSGATAITLEGEELTSRIGDFGTVFETKFMSALSTLEVVAIGGKGGFISLLPKPSLLFLFERDSFSALQFFASLFLLCLTFSEISGGGRRDQRGVTLRVSGSIGKGGRGIGKDRVCFNLFGDIAWERGINFGTILFEDERFKDFPIGTPSFSFTLTLDVYSRKKWSTSKGSRRWQIRKCERSKWNWWRH